MCSEMDRRNSLNTAGAKPLGGAGHVIHDTCLSLGRGGLHIIGRACHSDSAMLDFIAFLTCVEFTVLNSLYQEVTLKPKQVVCLENVYLNKDVLCVLPTGYGSL